MTDRERLAEALRNAYGNAMREERPMTAHHIVVHPFSELPHERRRKWLVMAQAAEIELAARTNRHVASAVATLRTMDCQDEPCLTPHDVLVMLGYAHEEEEETG